MADEPPPNIIAFPGKPPEPPPELGATGAELWRSIAAEWRVDGAATETVLLHACLSADRAESLRRQILAEGELIATTYGGTKANPLIALELTARSLTIRLLGRLGILGGGEKKRPGRPVKSGW
jgi:hypothetical protein